MARRGGRARDMKLDDERKREIGRHAPESGDPCPRTSLRTHGSSRPALLAALDVVGTPPALEVSRRDFVRQCRRGLSTADTPDCRVRRAAPRLASDGLYYSGGGRENLR
jgi:hypothetical protein